MSQRIRIAIDLAKLVFQLAISDRPGKVTRRPRLGRAELLPFLAQQPRRSCTWRPVARLTTGDAESSNWAMRSSYFRPTTFDRMSAATRPTARTHRESWMPVATRI